MMRASIGTVTVMRDCLAATTARLTDTSSGLVLFCSRFSRACLGLSCRIVFLNTAGVESCCAPSPGFATVLPAHVAPLVFRQGLTLVRVVETMSAPVTAVLLAKLEPQAQGLALTLLDVQRCLCCFKSHVSAQACIELFTLRDLVLSRKLAIFPVKLVQSALCCCGNATVPAHRLRWLWQLAGPRRVDITQRKRLHIGCRWRAFFHVLPASTPVSHACHMLVAYMSHACHMLVGLCVLLCNVYTLRIVLFSIRKRNRQQREST